MTKKPSEPMSLARASALIGTAVKCGLILSTLVLLLAVLWPGAVEPGSPLSAISAAIRDWFADLF